MQTGRIVVTGGAGFVGARIAAMLGERAPDAQIVTFDELGNKDAVMALGPLDALVDCTGEGTPLMSTYHCLELARRYGAQVVFLSTSRVYPLRHLRAIAVEETESRFEIAAGQELPGVSADGISEEFPVWGRRSSSKLAAEQLVEDYVGGYGLRAVVNRLGLVGPRPDLRDAWAAAKQVRDLLHVDDVAELVAEQLAAPGDWAGEVVNVGGGRASSLSLIEAGDGTEPGGDDDVDYPVYISDCTRLFARSAWRPRPWAAV